MIHRLPGMYSVTSPGSTGAPVRPAPRTTTPEKEPEMLDVVFVGTVLALFALIALVARGVANL